MFKVLFKRIVLFIRRNLKDYHPRIIPVKVVCYRCIDIGEDITKVKVDDRRWDLRKGGNNK